MVSNEVIVALHNRLNISESVLNHHGVSATRGHYTLDVLYPDSRDKGREGWIRIDDEFVQNIQVEDLLVRDVGDDRNAYLLFYRRVYPPGPGVL